MSVDDTTTTKLDMTEIGVTGLKHMNGMIFEERLRELQGELGYEVYSEMSDNDAVIGAVLFTIEMLIRNVKWRVEPFESKSPDAIAKADFVTQNMNDMDRPWEEVISETLTMLIFGFAPLEQTFKRRNGLQRLQLNKDPIDRIPNSRFNDGMVGWHKMSLRAQDTITRWKLADNGDIQGFWQRAAPKFEENFIPIEKILLFRTTTKKNNPQGRSILRNAYRAWFFKKRMENIEGIGVERDLAGLPVAKVPPNLLSKSASQEEKATLEAIKRVVINIRRDEQEGVVFPMKFDKNNNPLYALELLTTGGSRQFKTDDIIKRYRTDIALTVIADFILLGHDKAGSFSMHSSKTNLFASAIGAWMSSISSIHNRCSIPLLLQLNGMDLEEMPTLEFGDIESISLEELSKYITSLAGVGVDLSGEKMEAHLKKQANLPLES